MIEPAPFKPDYVEEPERVELPPPIPGGMRVEGQDWSRPLLAVIGCAAAFVLGLASGGSLL